MCGRYAFFSPVEALRNLFDVPDRPNLPPRYNIAPTQPVLVLRPGQGEQMETVNPGPETLTLMRWGLIPNWSKDPDIGGKLFNARSETVAEKPSFRAAFKRRRCLIPADGFYEWRGRSGDKRPFFIHMTDDKPFAFAGLWEYWMGADGSEVDTCTILTTEASEPVRQLHHRMPVILDKGQFQTWLRGSVPEALGLLRPYAGEREISFYQVGKAVNRVANDGPALIEPVGPDDPADQMSLFS
ncbi:SOS response-associated peptidase [Aestuariispira ectoiniformans]|uniref:SOS response-associated peptidase n=1 Tax=Aestuariispira ectoiniformans TaxID=2775080 RepID=UPI00223BFF21|nr:SOS response-associated peptidase [Aestuariispira ectoiniformans]